MISTVKTGVHCYSEYEALKKVVVCEPTYMQIAEIINETQRKYAKSGIHVSRAEAQHREFIATLEEHGAKVVTIKAQPNLPEQVFTRDIGFTIGDTVVVSKMSEEVRQGEEERLEAWLRAEGFSKVIHSPYPIEGGDVLVDGKQIYIGVSGRTTREAISFLSKQLPEFTITPVPIPAEYLHLDCVFNIISPTEAMIFSRAFGKKERELLSERFHLIEVDDDERFTMGVNMLSIGNRKIISLPENKKINRKLRARGYKVLEVEFSEIIKSGGSFRCCSMPVERG